MIKKSSIFKNSEKSRALWHDVKKFPSAENIYLENILHGVYGNIPKKLQVVISDLKIGLIQQILFIENLSITNKIELGSLELKKKTLLLAQHGAESIEFLSAFFVQKKQKVILNAEKDDSFRFDTRYANTLIQNILALISAFSIEKTKITVSKKEKQIIFSGKTTESSESIHEQLNPDTLFDPQKGINSFPPLLFYTTMHFAKSLNASFHFYVESDTLYAIYEEK